MNNHKHRVLLEQAKRDGIMIGRQLVELEQKFMDERPNIVRAMAKQQRYYEESTKGTIPIAK